MPPPLVECIPNFSEARRPEVIAAIVDSIARVSGVCLLDHSSDLDHNRTVVTFAGPPEAVVEASFGGIATAARLINLDEHRGEHPRMGATDVVPFVPLAGISLKECVELAHSLGKRVGEELKIPVYLYEAAATRPDRENLADIRRGEYEKLKQEIGHNPDRKPDYGPERVGPAGAVIIGARQALIAFNAYLNTADVNLARNVAKAVRNSSGGLHYVKALGLLVEGQAQVSMNLTDFTRTSVARVVEFVRREAARYGAAITHTELVGLIPRAALVDAAQWYLQLDGLQADQILENRLESAIAQAPAATDGAPAQDSQARAAEPFIELLAAGTATPGGGAAAAATAAMAAALVEMVARLTIAKKRYAEVMDRMQAVLEGAQRLRAELSQAVADDSAAFEAVMVAFKLPKGTSEEQAARAGAVETAYHDAAEVPLRVCHACLSLLGLTLEVAGLGNLSAISDAGTAAHLARAALASAALNVRANSAEVRDKEAAQAWRTELAELETRASATFAALERTLDARVKE